MEAWGFYRSPLGWIKIVASKKGISNITFVEGDVDAKSNALVEKTQLQLEEYFQKTRTQFDLTLDFEGTDFQQSVWKLLMTIPLGRTETYMGLAKRLGDSKAVRAVANANAKNPFAIVVPCHRIIGAKGELTGYAWGVERKRKLLQLEGGIQADLFT